MGNESERLASLEAQFAAVDTQLSEIKTALLRMDTKLDAWQSTYVPRAEINEMFRSRDEKITLLHQEIIDLNEEKKANKQLLPTWTHAAVALIALALSIYMTLGGK